MGASGRARRGAVAARPCARRAARRARGWPTGAPRGAAPWGAAPWRGWRRAGQVAAAWLRGVQTVRGAWSVQKVRVAIVFLIYSPVIFTPVSARVRKLLTYLLTLRTLYLGVGTVNRRPRWNGANSPIRDRPVTTRVRGRGRTGGDGLTAYAYYRVGPLHRETAWLGVGLRAD